MLQNTKVRIPNESPLPYIAAFLTFLSAGAILLNARGGFSGSILYRIFFIILPVIFCLLFSVLAAALAKKIPHIMIIPVLLICLSNLLEASGLSVITYNGGWGLLRSIWRYNLLEILLKCLLIILVLILGILAFYGVGNLPFIIVCAISAMINIAFQAWNFTRYSHFYIPWFLLYVILFHGAFITMALAIQKDKLHIQNSNLAAPPFRSPYPYTAPMPGQMGPGTQYQSAPQPMMGQPVMNQQAMNQQAMNQQVMNRQDPMQNQASYSPQNNMQQESDIFGKINQLYEMNKKGIITNEEFESKRKELLAKIQ